jgi:tetratricopeptide (TPR) repeat protein
LSREKIETLLHLVDDLPPRLHNPFILYVFREMSYRDLADQLHLSEEAACKRVQEARQVLREQFQDYLSGSAGRTSEGRSTTTSSEASWESHIMEIEQQTERLLEEVLEEIRHQVVDTSVVQIALPSGAVMNFYLTLETKTARREVKIKTLRQYVQRYPTGWKKRLELAHLLYATGQWEEAIEEYRQVLKKQPRLLEVQLRLGEILRLLERGEEARTVYATALPQARKPATQHHLRGLRELCGRDYDTAAQEFAKAASLEPRNAAHWHALGRTHDLAGHPRDALQAYDEALQLNPDDIVALMWSHNALFPTGRFTEARQRLERVVEIDPHCVLALKTLAACRSGAGWVQGEESRQTEQLIRQALRLAPESPDVWETQANFYFFRGEWEKSAATLRKFVEMHPHSAQGWFHCAKWLIAAGDFPAAADAVLRSHALYPEDLETYRTACEVLPLVGRMDELRQIMEEMLARFPDQWTAYKSAGLTLVRWFREPERACQVASRMTELQPHLAESWLYRGEILVLTGRLREAIPLLEKARQLSPGGIGSSAILTWAALRLGESYRSLGDEPRARTWFEEAARRAPEMSTLNAADAHFYLGKAREALGDPGAARQSYQAALSQHLRYPVRQEAEEALRRLPARN